ncbi:MAG: hypothetical protein U1E42_00270 [Rhodospirillales bacterium]
MKNRYVLIMLAVCVVLTGCGEDGGVLARFLLKSNQVIVEQRPDPAYEELFPFYVDLCTISQFARRDGRQGNPFGHALFYIKGACKDENAPFPQLRRCRSVATSLDDPEHGAGVSVGRWFRNVNWIAIPGYQLVFPGNLQPGERLTQAHFDATVREAIAKGVYDGVELHDGWARRGNQTLEDFVANHSISADFAVQFARNVFCARVPVTEPILNEVISFLNDKNHEYATGKADYSWHALADNCVHTVRNALAAANVWSPLSVRETKLMHLFNLAIPANQFVNLAMLGAEGPLEDYQEIQDEGPSRDALHDFHWLPTRHGALLKTLPVHQPNDVFETRFRLFALQSPFTMGRSATAVRLLSDPRFVDLETNLRYFRDKYQAILEHQDYLTDPLASVRGSPYRRVERLHLDYIEAQLRDVEEKLSRLAERKAARPSDPPAAE